MSAYVCVYVFVYMRYVCVCMCALYIYISVCVHMRACSSALSTYQRLPIFVYTHFVYHCLRAYVYP